MTVGAVTRVNPILELELDVPEQIQGGGSGLTRTCKG